MLENAKPFWLLSFGTKGRLITGPDIKTTARIRRSGTNRTPSHTRETRGPLQGPRGRSPPPLLGRPGQGEARSKRYPERGQTRRKNNNPPYTTGGKE